MKDKISEARIKLLHPAIRDEVLSLMDAAEKLIPENAAIRIVQGLRTFAEQEKLYAIGRTLPGRKVTNAKAGSSYHNWGLAIDFCLLYDIDGNGSFEKLSWKVNDDWKTVGIVFEDANWSWGHRWSKFTDSPHLEKTFGFDWRQLLAKHKAKHFIEGTEYVDLMEQGL